MVVRDWWERKKKKKGLGKSAQPEKRHSSGRASGEKAGPMGRRKRVNGPTREEERRKGERRGGGGNGRVPHDPFSTRDIHTQISTFFTIFPAN